MSSPAQTFTQQRQTSNGNLLADGSSEPSADAIATGLFDDQPGNTDIGYFGISTSYCLAKHYQPTVKLTFAIRRKLQPRLLLVSDILFGGAH